MRAEIISIGNELLSGDTLNTNTYYITRRLTELGIDVFYHTSVNDDVHILKDVIDISLRRVDLVIFTGGLGPTYDDMTKEVVSSTLGLKLILNDELKEALEDRFRKNNRKMTPNNLKQVYIPEGAKYLINEIGTAPGIFLEWNDKVIVMLPGPPKEMKTMFDKYVIPLIKQDNIIEEKIIKTIGIGESQLESAIEDIIKENKDVYIATFAKEGIVDIKIVVKGKNKDKLEKLLDDTIRKIRSRIGNYIYSYEDERIEEVVFKILKKKNMKIAFCESCTGGLIASKFTRIPGVSEVFDRALVTYSNTSKMEELNVSPDTLIKHGAVSKETAYEMAKGLMEKTGVDVALSVTGIAGPSGGSDTKPVGLVYIGICTKESSKVIESIFNGDRVSIQNRTYLKAFNELRKYLLLEC
ncbi:MAG: competence/damage-inducible protein A [Tissierellia bacterium]|nr:competence/damage-inducible protein A [Tissierellia bacterium]